MNKNVLRKLVGAEDETAQRLSEYAPDDEDLKERLFAMSEERVKDMKRNENEKAAAAAAEQAERFERLDVKPTPVWFSPLRTAAACAAVLVVGGAVFGVLLKGAPQTADSDEEETASESCTVSETEFDGAADGYSFDTDTFLKNSDKEQSSESKSESFAQSKTADKGESSAQSKSQNKSEAESKNESKSESGQTSGSSDSSQSASSFIPPVPMPATEIKPADESSEAAAAELAPEESAPSEQTIPAEGNIGETTSEKVSQLKDGMTYAQVFEILGTPDRLGIPEGYAQYIVDGDKLLILRYTSEDDTVGTNGDFLQGVELSSMYANESERTFDGYAAWSREDKYYGGVIRLTCPQYGLHCADVVFTDEQQEYLKTIWLGKYTKLRITHTDEVLESYPPIVYAEKVEVITAASPNE